MSGRGWVVLLLAVAVAGWWFSPGSPRRSHGYAAADALPVNCVLPPRVDAFDPPRQTPAPSTLPPFRLEAATLTPLAGFSIDAKVLSRKDYRSGREAELSPTDLALGWGRMRDPRVLDRLRITQSGRWFHYRYSGEPPIPPAEIVRSAANMHMIPSSDSIADALDSVRPGERVRIDGWLVEAEAKDGWLWRSSTSRDDSGNGACEVVYVCSITRL